MEVRKELYIGGRWVAPETDGDIDVVDSRTEEVMGSVPRGGGAEVERAVAAAQAAFPAWSQTPMLERTAVLRTKSTPRAARSIASEA